MKEVAASPAIPYEWESEPGKQLVQGHGANERAAAPNSSSRRLSLPPSLLGAQRGASFSYAPSDHFCPLPEFSASSPQALSSEGFLDSSPHVLHPWAPRAKAVLQQTSCAKTPSLSALEGGTHWGTQLAAQHPAKQPGRAGIPSVNPHIPTPLCLYL